MNALGVREALEVGFLVPMQAVTPGIKGGTAVFWPPLTEFLARYAVNTDSILGINFSTVGPKAQRLREQLGQAEAEVWSSASTALGL